MEKAIGWQEIPEKAHVSKYKANVSIKEVYTWRNLGSITETIILIER